MATASPSPIPVTASHTPSPDGAGASGNDGGDNEDEGRGRPSRSGYNALSSSEPNNPRHSGVGVVSEAHEVPESNRSEMFRSVSPLHQENGEHTDAGNGPYGANAARNAAADTGVLLSPTQTPKPNPDATAAATAPLLTGAGAGAQAAEEVADVAIESKESEALWKKARPRVRFFTHQVRLNTWNLVWDTFCSRKRIVTPIELQLRFWGKKNAWN